MSDAFIVRRGGFGRSNYPETEFDGDALFSDEGGGNWNIRLLTSGTFSFTRLGNAAGGIEVFAVGGGGAGSDGPPSYDGSNGAGGGGYTASGAYTPERDTAYAIVIGAGGTHGKPGTDGGSTSAFGVTANGGKKGLYVGNSDDQSRIGGGGNGGNGGSGGASGLFGNSEIVRLGGTNGGNGAGSGGSAGGTGQGTSTKAFGAGTAYANGGDSVKNTPVNGAANTGNGGSGGGTGANGGNGGSGIVIIRNRRS